MAKQISSQSALILIVIAQFLGTSLWFAGNAAAIEWEELLGKEGIIPMLTSVVQLGFISGTLLYAFWSIPDRYSPSEVFFFSAILAALSNLAILILPLSYGSLLTFRFLVGFFLAGIYPVGMKIAADYFEKGLGSALGFLVGALVLGTAFPFLIKALGLAFSWKIILFTTSGLALIGGVLVGFFVPDGPFRKINPKFDLGLLPKLSKNKALKASASGYFGHMWELYTFWAFLPALISFLVKESTPNTQSLWTFFIIAIGGVSCAVGGFIASKKGSDKVALWSLTGSGLCGLILLLVPNFPLIFVLPFLLIWGILVTADSPQFSTLVAQSVNPEHRGTALTLVNCMGFALTVVSIQFTRYLGNFLEPKIYLGLLFLGPLLGVLLFKKFKNQKA
ncbi:nitrate/nitrite transporter NarK [Algoriphagus boseongensis]|uniref:Nitrate/nitrite transporter NarK n=1 Tax=Algoriphagus boseongensis TaxID=1442587 RepID=A0A4R6T8Z1_9BACT|nr:MFS transporter [Algoriphagus boseongensis]TDQ18643.1 nitrate/nitrite transporter NarK [Algoriphagus boseongensis]